MSLQDQMMIATGGAGSLGSAAVHRTLLLSVPLLSVQVIMFRRNAGAGQAAGAASTPEGSLRLRGALRSGAR